MNRVTFNKLNSSITHSKAIYNGPTTKVELNRSPEVVLKSPPILNQICHPLNMVYCNPKTEKANWIRLVELKIPPLISLSLLSLSYNISSYRQFFFLFQFTILKN